MITKFKFTPQGALSVRTQIHTAPEAFGKAMPRMSLHEATWNWKSKDLAAQMERSTETNLVYISPEYPGKTFDVRRNLAHRSSIRVQAVHRVLSCRERIQDTETPSSNRFSARVDMSGFPTAAFARVEVYTGQSRFGMPPQVEVCSHSDIPPHHKSSIRAADAMISRFGQRAHEGVS